MNQVTPQGCPTFQRWKPPTINCCGFKVTLTKITYVAAAIFFLATQPLLLACLFTAAVCITAKCLSHLFCTHSNRVSAPPRGRGQPVLPLSDYFSSFHQSENSNRPPVGQRPYPNHTRPVVGSAAHRPASPSTSNRGKAPTWSPTAFTRVGYPTNLHPPIPPGSTITLCSRLPNKPKSSQHARTAEALANQVLGGQPRQSLAGSPHTGTSGGTAEQGRKQRHQRGQGHAQTAQDQGEPRQGLVGLPAVSSPL